MKTEVWLLISLLAIVLLNTFLIAKSCNKKRYSEIKCKKE